MYYGVFIYLQVDQMVPATHGYSGWRVHLCLTKTNIGQ